MAFIGLNWDEQTKQQAIKDAEAAALVAASGGLNPIADINFALAHIKLLADLFSNRPNPNDWVGWDALDQQIGAPTGTNVLNWVINDGDSVENEALNIISYIKSKGFNNLIGYSSWFKRTITLDDIADKLKRGGFLAEANAFKEQYTNEIKNSLTKPPQDTFIPVTQTPPVKNAGINIYVILALAGAAIFAITKIKK
jgi:hypothetical protein